MQGQPPSQPLYSNVQQASQLPPDVALQPTDAQNEQLAAIHRHLGTLAVGNATGWTHQPK